MKEKVRRFCNIVCSVANTLSDEQQNAERQREVE